MTTLIGDHDTKSCEIAASKATYCTDIQEEVYHTNFYHCAANASFFSVYGVAECAEARYIETLPDDCLMCNMLEYKQGCQQSNRQDYPNACAHAFAARSTLVAARSTHLEPGHAQLWLLYATFRTTGSRQAWNMERRGSCNRHH